MTREEAIETLKLLKPNMRFDNSGWLYTKQALDMAIKALSQEPCIYDLKNRYCPRLNEHGMLKYPLQEPTVTSTDKPMTMVYPTIVCDDAVSRQSVLEAVSEGCQEWRGIYGRCEELINELPSVNPQPCDDVISRDAVLDLLATRVPNPYYENVFRAVDDLPSVTQTSETVTEFADRCRECGARYGKLLEQKSGKWIDVNERLPEDAYGCLATVEIDNVSMSECVQTILNYWVGYDGETWNNSDGIPIPYEVIAWMPLPKPYEPQESEDKE